ncbi:zinc ABC transporter substrate-binding protein [Marinilactibacillus sp. XAAS-LB27]|uniref:metal ABC transporter solute-binding protein, Zn/Mn family n=1 Tax=Marinilactibacillus sp. XAAS-LB27 TaxID=3114538 RepID=UPI002E170A64|nr:zinc ABC transporter substrate-binding protein [Marinilactibacillus sp. XAAS-LB27]
MKHKRLASAMIGLTAATTLFACAPQGSGQNSDADTNEEAEVSIVTSFYPMYEFTKQVAGDRADIRLMVGGGDDAHHYEPSAQDVAAVNEADLFVYSSDSMESWTESLFDTIDNDDLMILSASDGAVLDTEDQNSKGTEESGNVTIEGASGHYHTGDSIELTATVEEETTLDHWHWYTREDENAEWETISDEFGSELTYEVPGESFEVQAVLFGDDHDVFAESEPLMIEVDNHGEDHSEGEAHDHEHGEEDADDHEHNEGEVHDHEHGEDDADDHEHNESEAHDHEHGEVSGGSEGLEVAGLAGHYHTGDAVTLKVETQEDIAEWQWSTRQDESAEWAVDATQTTEAFDATVESENFEIQGVGLDDEGNEVANTGTISVMVDNHENEDPHSWLDPVFVQEQVNGIRDALIEIDPEGESVYTENAASFNSELQALDQEFQEAFEGAENRVFVVQHQAFGYIAERYDLEQVAIGGLSTEVEPSPARIAEIGDLVQENNVPVIYYQQGAKSSIAQTVATETGTETAVLHDLESLSEELQSEDLGYIDAMRENIESLKLSIN